MYGGGTSLVLICQHSFEKKVTNTEVPKYVVLLSAILEETAPYHDLMSMGDSEEGFLQYIVESYREMWNMRQSRHLGIVMILGLLLLKTLSRNSVQFMKHLYVLKNLLPNFTVYKIICWSLFAGTDALGHYQKKV